MTDSLPRRILDASYPELVRIARQHHFRAEQGYRSRAAMLRALDFGVQLDAIVALMQNRPGGVTVQQALQETSNERHLHAYRGVRAVNV